MKTLFIINPVSGKGVGSTPEGMIRQIDAAYQKAGFEYEVKIWEDPEGLGKLIDVAVDGGFDVVVAAGGDGTINEIARRLVGTDLVLGVIPIGSGNGFARHLGISRNPRIAISQLIQSEPREVDLGDFGGMTFINNAGIGIDAAVAEAFTKVSKRGFSSYLKLTSQAFFQFKKFDCKIIVDGEREYECTNLMLMDIANGPQWGNGAKIAPVSKIDDGYLEAVVMQKARLFQIPRLVKLLFSGKIYRHPSIKFIRGKSFEIYRLTAGRAHVDGEYIHLGAKITCKILEKSIKLLYPRTQAPALA